MIYSLKELFQNNDSNNIKHFIKDQIIDLFYNKSIKNNITIPEFSNIICENNIYIDIDEKFVLNGLINYYIKTSIIGTNNCFVENLLYKNIHTKNNLIEFCIEKNKDCCKIQILCNKEEENDYNKYNFTYEKIQMFMNV